MWVRTDLVVPPSLRNDYRLISGYTRDSAVPIDIPIVALAGRTDPKVTMTQMNYWAELAPSGSFRAAYFEGGHFYLQSWVEDVVSVVGA